MFVFKREQIYVIVNTIQQFNDLHFTQEIYSAILIPHANLCVFTVNTIKTLYMGSALLIAFYPLIVYLLTNEIILHFGFILPWIDADSTHGFILNVFHHLLQIFLVSFGFIISDSLYIVFGKIKNYFSR